MNTITVKKFVKRVSLSIRHANASYLMDDCILWMTQVTKIRNFRNNNVQNNMNS